MACFWFLPERGDFVGQQDELALFLHVGQLVADVFQVVVPLVPLVRCTPQGVRHAPRPVRRRCTCGNRSRHSRQCDGHRTPAVDEDLRQVEPAGRPNPEGRVVVGLPTLQVVLGNQRANCKLNCTANNTKNNKCISLHHHKVISNRRERIDDAKLTQANLNQTAFVGPTHLPLNYFVSL